MITIFVGCAAVWGIVTGMTGGNWEAGGVVAFVVLCVAVSGHRATASASQERRIVIMEEEPERKRWF